MGLSTKSNKVEYIHSDPSTLSTEQMFAQGEISLTVYHSFHKIQHFDVRIA